MNYSIRMVFSIGLISIYSTLITVSTAVQTVSDTASNKPDPQPTSSSLPQTDHSAQPYPPSLTCILFHNFGCNIQCYLEGNLRLLNTAGTCTPDILNCSCTIDMPLSKLWPLKFQSTGVLRKIENDKDLAEEVLNALRDPYLTPEESKLNLKKILSPELFEDVKVKNFKDTPKPKPVPAMLSNRVNNEWKPEFEDTSTLQSVKYEEKLVKYLEENKNNQGIRKVFEQILLTENTVLREILVKFLDDHKDDDVGKYDLSNEEKTLRNSKKDLTTNEVLNNIIINKLITEIDSVLIKNQSKPVIPPENHPTKSEVN